MPFSKLHNTLMHTARWLAKQKLRYDLGAGFMSIATFTAALIGASDKIAAVVGVSPAAVVITLCPAVLLGIWLLGYILDSLQFYNSYQDEMNKRNAKLMEALRKSP